MCSSGSLATILSWRVSPAILDVEPVAGVSRDVESTGSEQVERGKLTRKASHKGSTQGSDEGILTVRVTPRILFDFWMVR